MDDLKNQPDDNKPADEEQSAAAETELVAGLDYYLEDGLFVFTAHFLTKRGYCCESGCRHCPYDYAGKRGEL